MSNDTCSVEAPAESGPLCLGPAVVRVREIKAVSGRNAPRLAGFAVLLLSNAISGICFSYIASRRWAVIPMATVVFAVAYTQWVNLGVTVAKFGFDTYLYAMLTRNPRTPFDLSRFLSHYSLPAAAAFALLTARLFTPLQGVLCGGIILLETASVLITSEQSARQRYTVSAVSSLLKYPLFFLLLLACSRRQTLDTQTVAAALAAAALCRFLYGAVTRPKSASSGRPVRPSLWCAVNQPLNFLLYRVDQLLLPLIAIGSLQTFGGEYAYLAKWPELISGTACTAGLVWFPVWWKTLQSARHGDRPSQVRVAAGIALYALAIAAATFVYCLGSRSALPLALVAPFASHAVLVLPVNFGNFLLLRTNRLPGLVHKLLQALCLGLPLLVLALIFKQPLLLAWAIPCQLLAFIAVVAARSWGRRYSSYGRLAIR